MYILSNGVKITEKMHIRLCRAVKDTSKKHAYFLELETGKLIRVPRAHRQKLAAIQQDPQRCIPLPKVTENERRERFRAFVEELGVIDVPELEDRLCKEIKQGASLDKLEQILEEDPSGWIHGWAQDEQFLLAERIEEWITDPPLSAKDDLDYWYFDDCPICQMMKKMEEGEKNPTIAETREAFLQAKERGGFVGGDMFHNPNEVDKEVDELLEMAKNKRFEPGIYNFCDRWCEKCKDTQKCFLYAQERQRRGRNTTEGKDNGYWLEEVKHSFEITRRMIERNLKEEGIDPQKVLKEKPKGHWDDDAGRRYDRAPCLMKAREYMKEVAIFLDNFHQNRFQYYPQLGMEIGFDDIKEEIEAISWYHTFLPSKIWRTLYEKECFNREKDRHLKELMGRDLEKFYLLVIKCINKSIEAWRDLAKKRKEFSGTAENFLTLLGDIQSLTNQSWRKHFRYLAGRADTELSK